VGRKGAERRVLTLQNPGFPPAAMGTTETLVAAVQFIHGNEVAPSHRHTMAALRFIVEGKGACTVVNGEPESMEPGDLLLTPSWYWHGHFSEHDEPMIWMDGLDVPFVMGLAANFQEEYPENLQQAAAPRDESIRQFSGGGLLPVGERSTSGNSPLLNYRWDQTLDRLTKLADRDGSPFDGIALRYSNPHTGGPVMPTIDCWIQMLRPVEHTRAHRHTGSVIYHVARGSGYTVINGQRFNWTKGDIFCIPSWALHEHVNGSASDDAILFSMNDSPVLAAFNLYREAAYEEGNGQQEVASIFAAV
jgi:gentisate 1,2-dioxygenase